jgi:hypothetical protein
MAPETQAPEQSFIISTDSEIGVRQLQRTARVLREYRELTASEIANLEKQLTAIFKGMVDVEFQRQREEAKRKGLPPPTRAAAEDTVRKRLNHVLALPVLTSDQRSVVAFGKLKPGAPEIARMAYEVDAPVATLETGAEVTAMDGAKALLVR